MTIKLGKLAHVGIGVRNMEETLKTYSKIFDIQLNQGKVNHLGFNIKEGEVIPAGSNAAVKVAFITMGNTTFEFFQWPKDSMRRGQRFGIFHVGFIVDDLKSMLKELDEKGVKTPEGYPRTDKLVYLETSEGVLIELVDKTWKYKQKS